MEDFLQPPGSWGSMDKPQRLGVDLHEQHQIATTLNASEQYCTASVSILHSQAPDHSTERNKQHPTTWPQSSMDQTQSCEADEITKQPPPPIRAKPRRWDQIRGEDTANDRTGWGSVRRQDSGSPFAGSQALIGSHQAERSTWEVLAPTQSDDRKGRKAVPLHRKLLSRSQELDPDFEAEGTR